jgi:hypothetical protein
MVGREKGPDEVFCRSCGEPIKSAAEICPHCGVRNSRGAGGSATGGREYTTTVSSRWWLGVVAGSLLWAVALALRGDVASLTALAWVVVPLSIYMDAKYVRANSQWRPGMLAYLGTTILLAPLAPLAGAFYLFRRHKLLGTP